MKKKTLTALLAALMALLLVLSACGKSDDDDRDDEKAETRTEEKTDAADDEAADETQPASGSRKHYKEVHWYDEDGEFLGIDYFDEDQHVIGFETRDGSFTIFEELRVTDACDAIDTTDIAAIPGVTEVEVRQYFSADSKDVPFKPFDNFGVFGYNARSELVGMQLVRIVEDRPLVFFTAVYTTGADGNESVMKRTAASGELLSETVDENTFDDDGNIVRKVSHWTIYGTTHLVDGEYVFEAYDEPETMTRTAEYVY